VPKSLPTCAVTGRIAGDNLACGDCDPCMATHLVPEVVKQLIKERDEWADKYADAMESVQDWKDRYESERRDHEATIKHCDAILD
jgi:hypothetical protein